MLFIEIAVKPFLYTHTYFASSLARFTCILSPLLCPCTWSQVQFMTVLWGFSDSSLLPPPLQACLFLLSIPFTWPFCKAGSLGTPAGGHPCVFVKASITLQRSPSKGKGGKAIILHVLKHLMVSLVGTEDQGLHCLLSQAFSVGTQLLLTWTICSQDHMCFTPACRADLTTATRLLPAWISSLISQIQSSNHLKPAFNMTSLGDKTSKQKHACLHLV